MGLVRWLFANKKYPMNCRGKSPRDKRDFVALHKPTERRIRDWRPWEGLVENQGSTQSCVSQGIEAMLHPPINILRDVDYRQGLKLVNLDAMAHYKDVCDTFYQGNQSKGSFPRDGMRRLKDKGILEISPQAGTVHKIKSYWRCNTLQEAENALITSGPVVAALKVYPSFYWCKGTVTPPGKIEPCVGYHQVCLVARIQKEEVWGFVIRNSWGWDWGDIGYAFVSDEILEKLVVEYWTCEYNCSMEDAVKLADRWMNEN